MDLNLMSHGTLELASPCCVLYNKALNLLQVWHGCMVFAITLIWYHKHRQTNTGHTWTNAFTCIWIYNDTTCFVRAAATCITLMNSFLIQKFTLQRSTMSLLFQNYSLVKVIHLLIRFSKTKSFS